MRVRLSGLAGASLAACVAAPLLAAGVAAPAAAGSYVYTSLDSPGAAMTAGAAINSSGETVGTQVTLVGHKATTFGWYDTGSGLLNFSAPTGKKLSNVVDVNDSGIVLGTYQHPNSTALAFTYNSTTGVSTKVNVAGAGNVAPYAINASGQIVGNYSTAFFAPNQGFELTGGFTVTLQVPNSITTYAYDINDAGTVVGTYFDTSSNEFGYTYAAATFTTFGVPYPNSGTYAHVINAGGSVGGTYVDSSGNVVGFRKDGAVYHSYQFPGATVNDVVALLPKQVIGNYYDAAHAEHGFNFVKGKYYSVDFPGAATTGVLDVNSAGTITGTYIDTSDHYHGFQAVCPAGQAPCTN